MTVQYSRRALESIAPGLMDFAPLPIENLQSEFRSSSNWLVLFGMRQVLGPKKLTPIADRSFRQFSRRTISAIKAYESMRAELVEFSKSQLFDSPKFASYFSGLDMAELLILNIQMANEAFVMSKIVERFEPEEALSKAISLANGIKHFGEHSRRKAGKNSILPVWFFSSGVSNKEVEVSFEEFHDLLKDMHLTATRMLTMQ